MPQPARAACSGRRRPAGRRSRPRDGRETSGRRPRPNVRHLTCASCPPDQAFRHDVPQSPSRLLRKALHPCTPGRSLSDPPVRQRQRITAFGARIPGQPCRQPTLRIADAGADQMLHQIVDGILHSGQKQPDQRAAPALLPPSGRIGARPSLRPATKSNACCWCGLSRWITRRPSTRAASSAIERDTRGSSIPFKSGAGPGLEATRHSSFARD